MKYRDILYREEAEIAYITLNRPDKLNAFSEAMLEDLRHCFLSLKKRQDIRILVVCGAGRAWSAGVDLALFQHTKLEPGYKIYEDSLVLIDALEALPQVTIAAVNGFTFTGAMELMMVFDLIIAANEAKIGDTHAKWGIPPKWGMTQRLQRQVGLRKAKELSFTAEAISGEEAERIGLVNKSVPLEELNKAVKELADKILANSAQGIRSIKHLYQKGSNMNLADAIQYERDYKMIVTDKEQELRNFKKNI